MERILLSEAFMKYPKQYVVIVKIRKEPELFDKSGEVFLIANNSERAYKAASELDESYGSTTVMYGFDDTPEIGGLSVCSTETQP